MLFPLLLVIPALVDSVGDDPSYQELDMFDWTSGLRVAYCLDAPIPDLISPFRRAMAKVVTKFCQNTTACNLRKPLIFNPEQIAMLDGFPKREFGSILLKFYIILPHSAEFIARQQRPLLPRPVVSAMMSKHVAEVANRLGWSILSYEKYPRYDSMTEFMNIAIIPIVIFSVPLMIFLAYWTSTLRPNMSSEAWLVTGSAGGKNAALRWVFPAQKNGAITQLEKTEPHFASSWVVMRKQDFRRTMEIIAEQNAEIEKGRRMDLTRNMLITGGNEGTLAAGQLLLNVARLSMASTQPKSLGSTMSPQIVVSPTESVTSLSTIGPMHAPQTHLTVTQKHKRRQSSVEDIKAARRARGRRTSTGQKRWKSGSIMLGAFSSRQGGL